MRIIAIIPARYASTRFPGKPLALLDGKPIIEHVYSRVSKVFKHICVATDDQRIFDAVVEFGGRAVMTSEDHRSGTDRCREALDLCEREDAITYDIVINVQGDEPFIAAEQLRQVECAFNDKRTDIATLMMPYPPTATFEMLSNPNEPKVVVSKDGFALYFSRSVIPYLRGKEQETWAANHVYYRHIGLYAYRANVLREVSSLDMGTLEKMESLEQLRWLENGYRINVSVTNISTIGIDTPNDLVRAEKRIRKE